MRWFGCLASTSMLLLSAACDQTFEPLASSDAVHLSIFGILNASADTQWIRVMPIRPIKQTSPDSFGMTVTLENVGTGRTVELRDSLFAFSDYGGPGVGSGTGFVHNFWTTEPIEPGATYRFSARRDTGQAAEAVVKIPEDYQVEMWIAQPPLRNADSLRITGLKYLPFLAQAAHFVDNCGSGVDTTWFKVKPASDGAYMIHIGKAEVARRIGPVCGIPVVDTWDLWLVGSDSIWPSSSAYSAQGLGRSELASNITNAVGFVGGVLTKTIPYEDCTLYSGGVVAAYEYCKLHYDETSAWLGGTVDETRCGDGPLSEATLTLTQIDEDPSQVRTYVTAPDGTFRFEALVPGTRYSLNVRGKPSGSLNIYSVHYDTLTFAPGEHRRYDVGL